MLAALYCIFFREVRALWDELYPFVDKRARQGTARLGLPTEPHELAGLVDAQDIRTWSRPWCGSIWGAITRR